MIAFVVQSQPGPGGPPFDDPEKAEKIKALKVGFITEQLNLSVAESQVFWPVYNAMDDELQAMREERKEDEKYINENMETLTDTEVSDFLEKYIKYQNRELDIRAKYHDELKKVLPLRKVLLLYKSEMEFKLYILELVKKKKAD